MNEQEFDQGVFDYDEATRSGSQMGSDLLSAYTRDANKRKKQIRGIFSDMASDYKVYDYRSDFKSAIRPIEEQQEDIEEGVEEDVLEEDVQEEDVQEDFPFKRAPPGVYTQQRGELSAVQSSSEYEKSVIEEDEEQSDEHNDPLVQETRDITDVVIRPSLPRRGHNTMRTTNTMEPKGYAPNSVNMNIQSMASEYKRTLKALMRSLNVDTKYISEAMLIHTQTIFKQHSVLNPIHDLSTFGIDPLQTQVKILMNKQGKRKQLPSLVKDNRHIFTEMDGTLNINVGLIFGYISIFNVVYGPIHQVHNLSLIKQQDPASILTVDLIKDPSYTVGITNDVMVSSKHILEHAIFYNKLFSPLKVKDFAFEFSPSYEIIQQILDEEIFSGIDFAGDDGDWKMFDFVQNQIQNNPFQKDQLFKFPTQYSSYSEYGRDGLHIYDGLEKTVAEAEQTGAFETSSNLLINGSTGREETVRVYNTGSAGLIGKCVKYAKCLQIYVAMRTILDILVITNPDLRQSDALMRVYQEVAHHSADILRDPKSKNLRSHDRGESYPKIIPPQERNGNYQKFIPFHKFCVFPFQYREFVNLATAMKQFAIGQSQKKLTRYDPIVRAIRDYVVKSIDLVRDAQAINRLSAYRCFLKQIQCYQFKTQDRVFALDDKDLDLVTRGFTKKINSQQHSTGMYHFEGTQAFVNRICNQAGLDRDPRYKEPSAARMDQMKVNCLSLSLQDAVFKIPLAGLSKNCLPDQTQSLIPSQLHVDIRKSMAAQFERPLLIKDPSSNGYYPFMLDIIKKEQIKRAKLLNMIEERSKIPSLFLRNAVISILHNCRSLFQHALSFLTPLNKDNTLECVIRFRPATSVIQEKDKEFTVITPDSHSFDITVLKYDTLLDQIVAQDFGKGMHTNILEILAIDTLLRQTDSVPPREIFPYSNAEIELYQQARYQCINNLNRIGYYTTEISLDILNTNPADGDDFQRLRAYECVEQAQAMPFQQIPFLYTELEHIGNLMQIVSGIVLNNTTTQDLSILKDVPDMDTFQSLQKLQNLSQLTNKNIIVVTSIDNFCVCPLVRSIFKNRNSWIQDNPQEREDPYYDKYNFAISQHMEFSELFASIDRDRETLKTSSKIDFSKLTGKQFIPLYGPRSYSRLSHWPLLIVFTDDTGQVLTVLSANPIPIETTQNTNKKIKILAQQIRATASLSKDRQQEIQKAVRQYQRWPQESLDGALQQMIDPYNKLSWLQHICKGVTGDGSGFTDPIMILNKIDNFLSSNEAVTERIFQQISNDSYSTFSEQLFSYLNTTRTLVLDENSENVIRTLDYYQIPYKYEKEPSDDQLKSNISVDLSEKNNRIVRIDMFGAVYKSIGDKKAWGSFIKKTPNAEDYEYIQIYENSLKHTRRNVIMAYLRYIVAGVCIQPLDLIALQHILQTPIIIITSQVTKGKDCITITTSRSADLNKDSMFLMSTYGHLSAVM